MIKFKVLTVVFLSILLLASCEEEQATEAEEKILTCFTEPFPKSGFNITRILGNEFSLKEPSGKTETYFLDYFSSDRSTAIRNGVGDTLYNGQIGRYRGLFFTTEISNDSTFLISAFSVQDQQLKGFMQQNTMLKLIDDSFSFFFDKPSEKPPYLTKCSPAGITFLTEKKLLKNIFNTFLEKMPYQDIVVEKADNDGLTEREDSLSFITDAANVFNYVKSYGPNPVSDLLAIEFNSKGRYTLNITDINGKTIERIEEKSTSLEIDFASYTSGAYILSISQGNKKETDQFKIIKN